MSTSTFHRSTTRELTGPMRERSRELNRRIYRTWMTEAGVAVVGGALGQVEDVTIAVTPHRWRAWDIASTSYPFLAAAGIPLDEPQRWFLP